MLMLTRRLQVLLDDDRYRRLETEAVRRQVSVALIVREAIDLAIPASSAGRRAAGDRILAAATMETPDPAELRAELEDLRARRR